MAVRGLAVLAVLALLVAPPLLPKYFLEVLINVLFFAYLGLAWNLLGGYAGQFSFGHAAFFGIGAYTSTLLLLRAGLSPWLGMIAGGLLATGFGLFEGYLSFRYGLRGPYFSLVTLAFAEMLRVVTVNLRVVGASLGLVVPSQANALLFVFADKLPYYYVIFTMTGAALVITHLVARSRLGYCLVAVRENEDAAEAAGVDARGAKLRAMAISAFLTALGGTFYAQYFAYIDPTITFGPGISIGGLLPAIVGGAGTVAGPVLGSFVLTPISEITRAALRGRAGADIMLYGLVLILVISFLPQGLMGWLRAAGAVSLLELRGLGKRFGGLAAVSQLDLAIEEGEIVGLIGPNGAGKTTAFHLIAGFHAPSTGTIRFKGDSIVGLKPHAICRRGLARTFQLVQPFAGLTALENVMVGAFTRERDTATARRQAGEILDFVGLGPRRATAASHLTLGDRKRLEMARGLATRPELLLLDEVMSGLNATEIEAIIGIIRRIHERGVTLLIIEHVMQAIMALSHRLVVLHHGEKIADGPPTLVARERKVIEAYLGEAGDAAAP